MSNRQTLVMQVGIPLGDSLSVCISELNTGRNYLNKCVIGRICHKGTFVHRILTRIVYPRDCVLVSLELVTDYTCGKIIFDINKISKTKFVGEKKRQKFLFCDD